ncbi:MAG: methyltransferase [Candidatus Schekmanbacteria bacterium RBG_16_38_10]|uniref:Methyltransferase n=1 Tax=Candidatus Schekmanbacteria bacterium RBG_16_38_10 TaxID=1817879 RepID=A0A1F7RZ35_9BACT|nr:MAG: methyltransferase [Candidatus Schekmanbacteria bacterium RBG_16_38_10]
MAGFPAFSPELAESNEGFKAGYFAELASIEASNFWFRARNRLIIWIFRQYFPRVKNFIEIGCGTGFVLSSIERTFPHLLIYGSEIYSTGLIYAAERLKRAELFQMDARDIPFENEFDVIGAFDVLEHIKEDDLVLSQMYKAAKEGGGIILTVPQHRFLWSQVDQIACHVRRYNATELKNKVERVGFDVVKMFSFVSLLLPLMIASRLRKRQTSHNCDATTEIKVSGLMNTILEKVLDIERCLIRLGINLPFGGSLILIARKV